MTKEEFIDKAREIHEIEYDYSLTPSIMRTHEQVEIVCPIHGKFIQEVRGHVKGQNCPQCARLIYAQKRKYTNEEFIRRANIKHNFFYDYDKVEYQRSDIPVIITCPKHGDFKQAPRDHLRGQGCADCAAEKGHPSKKKDTQTFIRQARVIHHDYYDYSKVVYQGKDTPIVIICPKHGEFKQTPHMHLSGQGCWRCRAHLSLFENEVRDYIKSIEDNIEFGVRNLLPHFEVDVYSPHTKIGFECDGLYWHSDKNKPKYYHINKTFEAEKQGIQLIHIFEDEWEYKRDICKSLIAKVLGACPNKIAPCCTKLIGNEETKQFLEQNSLMGCHEATLHIGLYDVNNELIAVGSFDDKDDYFEIAQYCERQDAIVENGFQFMRDYFVNRYRPNRLVLKIDKRWKNDLQLKEIGFIHIADELPSFRYVKDKRRLTLEEVLANEKLKRKHQDDTIPRTYDCGKEIWNFSETTDI